MDKTNLADEIVKITKELHGSVTHGDLISRLGDRVVGDCEVSIQPMNIVIFTGASQEFFDAAKQLKNENPKRVTIRPIELLCLLIDGCPIPHKMPLAKRPPKDGYKKPHFAPTCFNLVKVKET